MWGVSKSLTSLQGLETPSCLINANFYRAGENNIAKEYNFILKASNARKLLGIFIASLSNLRSTHNLCDNTTHTSVKIMGYTLLHFCRYFPSNNNQKGAAAHSEGAQTGAGTPPKQKRKRRLM